MRLLCQQYCRIATDRCWCFGNFGRFVHPVSNSGNGRNLRLPNIDIDRVQLSIILGA